MSMGFGRLHGFNPRLVARVGLMKFSVAPLSMRAFVLVSCRAVLKEIVVFNALVLRTYTALTLRNLAPCPTVDAELKQNPDWPFDP